MNIQLSVVIPTCKRPELLLKCLKALIFQQFDPGLFEVIVVTDGPDPLTEKALLSFKPDRLYQLRTIILPVKKGPAAARNYGWLAAKGELIVFTDDDCLPDENWLTAYHQEYLLGKTRAFTGKTIVPLPKHPTDYELNVSGLETADFITANCACPKKLLLLVGGFDEQFAMAWREDSEFEFKLIGAAIPIIKIKRAVVVHPVRRADWGISLKEQKKTMYNALLYKKYPVLYRQKIQHLPPVYYYAVISCFLLMLAGLISLNQLLAIGGLLLWLILSLLFAYNRIRFTSHRPGHLLEMIVTSAIIPFLSIYWQFYGAFKYRVLFI